jgi:plasmid maintenance system antidote protein VapI
MARTPVHPGEILGDEFAEIGLSAKRLADVIKVPPNRLYHLLAGKRSMTRHGPAPRPVFRYFRRFLDESPERL